MSHTVINKLAFSYNWNRKLYCRTFSTIRYANPNKYRIGSRHEIILKGINLGTGEITHYFEFNLLDISELLCIFDTGFNKKETLKIVRKMYKLSETSNPHFCCAIVQYITPCVLVQFDNINH